MRYVAHSAAISALATIAGSAVAQPFAISHSTSNTIQQGNSIACRCCTPETTFEATYWRSFDLSFFGLVGDVEITSVDIGVERAFDPTGSQPITVVLYTDPDGGTPNPIQNLQEIGRTVFNMPNASLANVSIPVTGMARAGATLVVAVSSNDHTLRNPPPPAPAIGAVFYIGSNRLGETGTSYMSTASCFLTQPTPTQGLTPGLVKHIVMTVRGEQVGTCPCACDFDTSTGLGVCDVFDFLAFGNLFFAGSPCACDLDTSTGINVCDIFDFLEFGNEFNSGCP